MPVTWLVAANDSYFSPALSRQLADAFRSGGGKVDFRVLPAYGSEGHWLPETEGGVKLAGTELDRALKPRSPTRGQKAMTLYFLVKYLHVLGAIVILGTGSGIAFFMLMAHRSGDAAFIARTAATVVIADMLFTLTAVLLQPVTGGVLMMLSATGIHRALAAGLARALCGGRAVLGARDLHADRDARSRARSRGRERSRCRRAISRCSAAGSLFGIPGFGSVMMILWLMIAKPF